MDDANVYMTMWICMILTVHIKMSMMVKLYVCVCVTTVEQLKKDRFKDFSSKDSFMKYLISL